MAGGKAASDRPAFDDTAPATDTPADPTDAAAAPPALSPTARYQLGAELGRGGMGRVVEAYDTQLGRTVALKEILPRAGANLARRFAREVQLTARLEHPSIVPLYDSGVTVDGRPYYVMRRVTGRPFDELIKRARSLGERLTLLPEMLAAIDAVAHAHQRHVIHRDLKPGNILVGELGETVVIDWGLAKAIGEADSLSPEVEPLPSDSLHTQIGAVFGTPGFMAPEQARGEELGTGGDVYALGACLYQLLAGVAPVAGKSLTEVLEKTHRHDIAPLAETAPGAPPELVAIVEKALAFEAARRYPHAGALAEDVRRFLDGQLVAAHQYTSRQRIARFVRRNRAALAVGALALVTVAVLAVIGVRRIVRERDAARDAQAAEVAARRDAELARDNERDRSDALLVAQARSHLETRPTETVALLKRLDPTSRQADAARALAQSAAMRGVVWAMQGPGGRAIPSLDLSGDWLALTSAGNEVGVYDLRRRALIRRHVFDELVHTSWVTGHRLLVNARTRAPRLFDPATGRIEELALPVLEDHEVSADGRYVLFRAAGQPGAVLLDLETRTQRTFLATRAIRELALAADASWLVLQDASHVIALDATGRELSRFPTTRSLSLATSSTGRFAFGEDTVALTECSIRPPVGCTPIALEPGARVLYLGYLGRSLFVRVLGQLHRWDGTQLRRVMDVAVTHRLVHAGTNLGIMPNGARLDYVTPYGTGSLSLPHTPLNAKLAGRPGVPRLVVVGENTPAILVIELAGVEPRFVARPGFPLANFSDDDTVLLHDAPETARWRWFDVHTARETPFEDPGGMMASLVDVARDGRTLVRSHGPHGFELRRSVRGTSGAAVIAQWYGGLQGGLARSLGDDATVYTVGGPALFGKVGAGKAHEVFALDSDIIQVTSAGPLRVAALSRKGELIRGSLGGSFERLRDADVDVLGRDFTGRLLVGKHDRLFAWDDQLVELGAFGRPIVGIQPVVGGVAVILADYEVQLLDPRTQAPPRRVLQASSRVPLFSADGRLAIGALGANELVAVELPAGITWTIPRWHESSAEAQLALAPSARRIVQFVPTGFVIRELPDAGPALHAYLNGLTNAVVDDNHVLAWPWQLAP